MNENEYIITYDDERRPFNCHMVLPLGLLQRLTAILREPILKGLVDSDGDGRVILQMNLDDELLCLVALVVRDFEMEILAARKRA
jgi:hypothetical protein